MGDFKNLVIDRWRQNNKNWNNFLLKDFFSTYSIENSHLSEKKNCMTLINSLFQNIDAKNKKVIYMYYFEGKTQSEISEHLGISISAISNKIKKSLRKVYLLLNSCFHKKNYLLSQSNKNRVLLSVLTLFE